MVPKTFLVPFIPLASWMLISGCGNSDGPKASMPATPVKIQQIVASEWTQAHSYSGNLEGLRKVSLSTKIMGPILEMSVTEGSRVSAGQIVARVKSDDIGAKKAQVSANLIEATAALKNVEINYQRIKNLYANQTATQKEMDDAEMAYGMAKARVQAVQEMEKEVTDIISFGDIVSPIQGFVVKRFLQQGDMAVPGMPILTVEDARHLRAVIQVPESDLSRFKKGGRASIAVDALPGVRFSGIVDDINPAGNPMSRQFEVKVVLQENNEALRSGMFARVSVDEAGLSNILVDRSSIVRRGQLDGIFVVNDRNEAILRWIRVGKQAGDQVEVLAGLAPGEQLVVESRGNLKDGSKVEVLP